MSDKEKRHIRAQINRLRKDADRHRAIGEELDRQAEKIEADLDYAEKIRPHFNTFKQSD